MLEIGSNVLLTSPDFPLFDGKTGVLVGIDDNDDDLPYQVIVKGVDRESCWFHEHEVSLIKPDIGWDQESI